MKFNFLKTNITGTDSVYSPLSCFCLNYLQNSTYFFRMRFFSLRDEQPWDNWNENGKAEASRKAMLRGLDFCGTVLFSLIIFSCHNSPG